MADSPDAVTTKLTSHENELAIVTSMADQMAGRLETLDNRRLSDALETFRKELQAARTSINQQLGAARRESSSDTAAAPATSEEDAGKVPH